MGDQTPKASRGMWVWVQEDAEGVEGDVGMGAGRSYAPPLKIF